MQLNIDLIGKATCNGCFKNWEGSVDFLLDVARNHHNKLDHPPYKLSTDPDIHNVFTLMVGQEPFEINVSSKFARIYFENAQLYRKMYGGVPNVLDKLETNIVAIVSEDLEISTIYTPGVN